MNWIDLVSAVLGLTCVVMAGRKLVANFWVGYLYSAFLFALMLYNGLYASMAFQLVAIGINVSGHWKWTHPKEGEKEADGSLAVSRISAKEYPIYVLASGLAFTIICFILRLTDDTQPVMDAACTSAIFLAQWLSAQKKVECWWVWLAVNVLNLTLYLRAGLVFMPIVAGLYIVNGIWSLITWSRSNERNS